MHTINNQICAGNPQNISIDAPRWWYGSKSLCVVIVQISILSFCTNINLPYINLHKLWHNTASLSLYPKFDALGYSFWHSLLPLLRFFCNVSFQFNLTYFASGADPDDSDDSLWMNISVSYCDAHNTGIQHTNNPINKHACKPATDLAHQKGAYLHEIAHRLLALDRYVSVAHSQCEMRFLGWSSFAAITSETCWWRVYMGVDGLKLAGIAKFDVHHYCRA